MAKKKLTSEEKQALEKRRFIFEVVVGSLLVALMIFIALYYGVALRELPH